MNLLIVDNSNIYISLKKQYPDDISSIRFNYDKFTKKFVSKEKLEKVIVGSTPPKTDTFWNIMKKQGWEVYTYERGKSGEKAVDTRIVARGVDFIYQCVNLNQNGHIYIMSGDLDMLPLIESAIDKNISVTVISWKNSINRNYITGDIAKNIKIIYLDKIAGELVFFEREYNGNRYRETLDEFQKRMIEKGNEEEVQTINRLKSGDKPSDGEIDSLLESFKKLSPMKKVLVVAASVIAFVVIAILDA